MTDREPAHPDDWRDDIRARFPDWQTVAEAEGWPAAKQRLHLGQEVVARAPFGVWIDIGVPFAAVLLVPDMVRPQGQPMRFEEYPAKETQVRARIARLVGPGLIRVTQDETQA